MATNKQTVGGIAGAALIAVSATIGINTYNKPAPIPVGHGICVNGKTDQPVKYQGKPYVKGSACTPVVTVPLPPKKGKHH